jgi:dihydroorotase
MRAGASVPPGAVGDVTVFDPTRAWTVDPARFRSRGRNSPYAGRTLRGRTALTVVGGRVVYQDEPA